MARLEITKPVRGELLDELIARGISPVNAAGEAILRLKPDRSGGWLEVPDNQRTVADEVIAAHDAAAVDQAAAQEATEDAADRDLARTMYAVLLADAARLEDTAQAMTLQVVRNHLARTDRALAAVLRQGRRKGLW